MFKQRLANGLLLLVGIFVLGLILGITLPRWSGLKFAPSVYNTATILKEVNTLSQMVTVEYVLERTVVVEVPPEGLLSQMFAGESRLLMLVQARVLAGLDLSRIKPDDLQVSGKRISVKLPPAQIFHAYLEDKQTRVVERTTGFLRQFDKDLEQSTRQNAVDDIRRAARTSGILKDADARAREQLQALFNRMGFEEVQFQNK
jgi:hypothetical protein